MWLKSISYVSLLIQTIYSFARSTHTKTGKHKSSTLHCYSLISSSTAIYVQANPQNIKPKQFKQSWGSTVWKVSTSATRTERRMAVMLCGQYVRVCYPSCTHASRIATNHLGIHHVHISSFKYATWSSVEGQQDQCGICSWHSQVDPL